MSQVLPLHAPLTRKVTDFPTQGDDQKISLRNSQWRTFDPDFAEMVRQDYPGVWSRGGNTLGNTQYRRLRPVVDRGGVVDPDSDTEEKAVRLREAWGARHKDNKNLPGVVAQVKWFVVGSRGESYMKRVLREAMKRADEERDAAVPPHWRRMGVTLCPPTAVVEEVARLLDDEGRGGVSLVYITAARRIANAMPTAEDLRLMVSDESRWTGGARGAVWAASELRRIESSHPLAFLSRDVGPDVTTVEGRDAYWRDWLREVQAPGERAMRSEMGEYLRAQRDMLAERAPDIMGQYLPAADRAQHRDLVGDILAAMFDDPAAAARLRARLRPIIERVLRRAFGRAVRDMAVTGLEWAPTIAAVDEPIGEMITAVEDTTRDAVAAVVRQSLADGVQITDLQTRIMQMPEFGRARALTIARTETGKVASTGTNKAIQDAASQGVQVRRMWITARDGAVRNSHRPMDGEIVEAGEPWTLPADMERPRSTPSTPTQGPGLSGVAGQDINCRCAVRPVINFGEE